VTEMWEKLNAYVDGELDKQSAADVAAEISRNPNLAAQVATLHRLKAATSQAASNAFCPAPPCLEFQAKWHGTVGNWKGRAIAACAIGIMVVGAFVALIILDRSPPTSKLEANAIERVFDAHLAWVSNPAAGSDLPITPARAPDLTGAGLRLVIETHGVVSRGDALFGYLGPRGCKLSLWIGRATDAFALATEPRRLPTSLGVERFAWRVSDNAYVVTTKGMDDQRLIRITRMIDEQVRQQPVSPQLPTPLTVAQGTTINPPCSA